MSSTLLIHYITQSGYLGIYVILGISILGLPIPDEFLMTFVGFLSFSGQLNPVLAILTAATGSMTGITIAYFLGRFFEANVLAYLKKHAGGERLEKVLKWYPRHGGKLLTVGYFIPGVRHLSGYIAGLSHLSYRNFAFLIHTPSAMVTALTVGSLWALVCVFLYEFHLYRYKVVVQK